MLELVLSLRAALWVPELVPSLPAALWVPELARSLPAAPVVRAYLAWEVDLDG